MALCKSVPSFAHDNDLIALTGESRGPRHRFEHPIVGGTICHFNYLNIRRTSIARVMERGDLLRS